MTRRVRTGSNIARPPAPSPTVPPPELGDAEGFGGDNTPKISTEALTALMAEAAAAHSMSEKLVTRDLRARIGEMTADSYDTAVILVSLGNRTFSSGNAGVEVLQAHLTLIKDMIVQQGGTVE